MKNKNTTPSEQFQNPMEKSIPFTQIHDRSLFWPCTSTSIESGGVKLVLWAQSTPLSEMMWSCKCFLHASKMSTFTYNLAIIPKMGPL
jgi:hypothetical protein